MHNIILMHGSSYAKQHATAVTMFSSSVYIFISKLCLAVSALIYMFHSFPPLQETFVLLTYTDREALHCSSKDLLYNIDHPTDFCILTG